MSTTARHVDEVAGNAPACTPAATDASTASLPAANAARLTMGSRKASQLRRVRVAYLRLCRALGGLRACGRYRGV